MAENALQRSVLPVWSPGLVVRAAHFDRWTPLGISMPRPKPFVLFVATLVGVAMAIRPALAADVSLDKLAWLAGCWQSEDAEAGSGEQWMPPADGTMLGSGRTIRAGKTIAYEFMRIGSTPEGRLAFFAQPAGKPPVRFPALRLDDTEVVFENPDHDFPQRVIYRLEPPARLRASIEGTRNGVIRRIEFPMARIGCGSLPKLPATQ